MPDGRGMPLFIRSIIFIAFFFAPFLNTVSTSSYAASEDEENTIAIYERVNAGVVNITNIAVTYDFFLNPVPSETTGSGCIVDKKGYILTNHHVIRRSDRLEVTLSDGSKWPAKRIGTDPQSDLAIIQIGAPPERLTVIPLGSSDHLRPGQKVLAIGNPFGLERTLTLGIISALRKSVKSGEFEMDEVIQTDAAINPGNSGGPLLNADGKMIGVNTAIFTPSGGSVGIGFAIPMNNARKIIMELMTKGYVAYPWLGIDFQALIPEYAEALSLPVSRGLLIARVFRGGPGHLAGIRGGKHRIEVGNAILIVGGDILTGMDGSKIESADDFHHLMKQKKPGERTTLTVWRGKAKKDLAATLGERPRS